MNCLLLAVSGQQNSAYTVKRKKIIKKLLKNCIFLAKETTRNFNKFLISNYKRGMRCMLILIKNAKEF